MKIVITDTSGAVVEIETDGQIEIEDPDSGLDTSYLDAPDSDGFLPPITQQ